MAGQTPNMLKRLPSFRELQTFVVTAEHLNFTHAATALSLTQSAVSRQVIALEQQLGVSLFNRHARGLSLTVQGMRFLPQVEQALATLTHAMDGLLADDDRIPVKAPTCIMPWLLPRLISFRSRYPQLEIELTSTVRHGINFATEHFHAAILYGQADEPGLEYHLLFDEVLTPMCSPELIEGNHIPNRQQLCQLTWLHASDNQHDWQLWLQAAQLAGLSAEHNQHFDTLDLATNAALQGFGITIGDLTLSAPELSQGRLIAPFNTRVRSGKAYYLVYPEQQSGDPNLQCFSQWLKQ
ncbi:LysR substrate-binding domain-containing protein [Aestuariirhabdus sp. Z084]|uniref:LysR substrate-binding domain-containing protein n=1 Tax=Aestuariirhabdus haliotis TaxID=2918751 RepID=UPI00201B3DBA|nr:LysR substrate-binding domain-containing protein [Aestuariirhabdus haliotis]MCL6417659.1 LysR substrate-binding domain-containing protein [Aestuariirhabdus haliotis]MCL6421579.1 LysR substrate-binding domain-containing protein [Aestuariirhabdus haliotis]